MSETADGKNWIHAPPNAPEGLDDTDAVMKNLAQKKINTFSGIGHGFYFWNFRTELPEAQWSYLLAVQKGWIPTGPNLNAEAIARACEREDNGQYKCVAKRDMLDSNVLNGIRTCVNADPTLEPEGTNVSRYEDLKGEKLAVAADVVFDDFWTKHRLDGATCDFGGVAQLQELNYTYITTEDNASSTWRRKGVGLVTVTIIVGGFILFMFVFGSVMMRVGGKVRESTLRKIGAIRKSYAALGDIQC